MIINKYLENIRRTSSLISWSKNGYIVYVPPTKKSEHNLLLTYLENINGKSWQLSKPQIIDVKLENNFLPEIIMVSWSTLSTDLAVSDIYGNFYIFLAGVGLLESKDSSPSYELTSYNHMEMIYRDIINQDLKSSINPNASIISFKWLNIEKPQILNKPANLINLDQSYLYTYGVNQYASNSISHPIPTKQACIALRSNGILMLYYQGEHKVEYHKISTNLGENLSITKASIGFTNEKQIIITVYDSFNDDIMTFTLVIDWGFLVESAKRQKMDPHYHTPKENQILPTLTLTKIHQMKPQPQFNGELSNPLSSIDIITASIEKESKLSILISYGESIIHRYEVVDVTDIISDAFKNQSTTTNPQQQKALQTIQLMDTIKREGKIQSIVNGPSDLHSLILYENGNIDVLDNKTWKIIGGEQKEEQFPPTYISTMFDVGFEFPKPEKNHLILAVSPNMTSIVYTEIYSDNDYLTIKPLEKKRNLGFQPKELFATSVAFAYRHAYSCYTNTCSDDLIILIQQEIKRLKNLLLESMSSKNIDNINIILKKFIESILSECHKSINFQLDAFSKESVDKLLSNPPLQKLLSLQLILGEFINNQIMTDISWIVLNLRSTNFGIMFSLSSIYRQISKKKPSEDTLQDSITRGECILSLIGNIKWLIDLMALLNQELLQLSYSKSNGNESDQQFQNSIVLPVLLSKVPRLFLMYAISSMSKTHEILKKLHKDLFDSNKLFSPMKESLNRYFNIYNSAPLTLPIFENYLRECDALISKEFANKLSNREKGFGLKLEQKLVCHGEIIDDLKDISKMLIDRYTMNINRETKLSELYFYNTSWLNIGFEKQQLLEPTNADLIYNQDQIQEIIPRLKTNQGIIDALRKIYIYEPKIRRCTRCRSISLVTDPLVFDAPVTIGLWTMVFQRTCICGNTWVNSK
ncbi:SIN4 [Candida pseudojiufengensis]|uniref:SIN4 n=1 Tax=Candida pseudojiufengensis TaxID=497109 RepID=UPI002225A0DD|nr:SIN4 [Candida pseudojiufengensis]KAI5959892.1 SIN4 [Candida pseudojiufengensis]